MLKIFGGLDSLCMDFWHSISDTVWPSCDETVDDILASFISFANNLFRIWASFCFWRPFHPRSESSATQIILISVPVIYLVNFNKINCLFFKKNIFLSRQIIMEIYFQQNLWPSFTFYWCSFWLCFNFIRKREGECRYSYFRKEIRTTLSDSSWKKLWMTFSMFKKHT